MAEHDDLIKRLRGSYKSLHGVVVVSPRLLEQAAKALEEAQEGKDV